MNLKVVSTYETRNPKPKTDSESWFQATKPETRNPKPTAKVGFKRRNPKPETRNPKPTAKVGFKRRNPKFETQNRQRKLVSSDGTRNPKPETRNPKPTRIRLLGGSPDRNSKQTAFCLSICESLGGATTILDLRRFVVQ